MDASLAPANESSPLEPSQDTMRRLTLAKQFLGHAIDHAVAPGALNQMIAVHNLHNSIEIALGATAMACDVLQTRKDCTFSDLMTRLQGSQVAKDHDIVLLYVPEVKELTEWRNLAQHAATDPDPNRVSSWIELTTKFITKLTQSFFGIDFALISGADLIEDIHAHALIKASESLQVHLARLTTPPVNEFGIPNDDHFEPYQVSLALLASAFVLAFEKASWSILFADFQALLQVPDLLCALEEKKSDDDALVTLWRRLKRLESVTMMSLLGIDYHLYQELVEVSPSVMLIKGEAQAYVNPQLSEVFPDPAQVLRFIGFATDLVLRWEGRGWLAGGIASQSGPDDPFVVAAQNAVDGRIPQLFEVLGEEQILQLAQDRRVRARSIWPEL